MLCDVKADRFAVFRNAQADGVLEREQDNGRYRECPSPCGNDGDQLNANLLNARDVQCAKAYADEQSCGDAAPSASDAVNAPHGQRVIQFQADQESGSNCAKDAANESDDDCWHWAYEACCRRYRYKSCDRAGRSGR